MEGPFETAETFPPQPLQQQPVLRQLEQQQQMLQSPSPTAEELAAEARRRYEAALRWVEAYEPDRLW